MSRRTRSTAVPTVSTSFRIKPDAWALLVAEAERRGEPVTTTLHVLIRKGCTSSDRAAEQIAA